MIWFESSLFWFLVGRVSRRGKAGCVDLDVDDLERLVFEDLEQFCYSSFEGIGHCCLFLTVARKFRVPIRALARLFAYFVAAAPTALSFFIFR